MWVLLGPECMTLFDHSKREPVSNLTTAAVVQDGSLGEMRLPQPALYTRYYNALFALVSRSQCCFQAVTCRL